MLKRFFYYGLIITISSLLSCKKHEYVRTAFYYWKTSFQITEKQKDQLKQTACSQLFTRCFDVNWNNERHQPYPNAVIRFPEKAGRFSFVPVIYIVNKTLENIADTGINSLAMHCSKLLISIAADQHINYKTVQFDCDWSLTTRDKYFKFLNAFRKISHCGLQATIRLHQVKYKESTGIPPVDTGVLMFYNMGKLDANPRQPNSIYNEADASKYVKYLRTYPLKLNVALPLFSWSIHVREGKVIGVDSKTGKVQLNDRDKFEITKIENNYRAKRSFFMDGIYVKQNDIFKLEETDIDNLNKAANQLIKYLPEQAYRTIIYYELANIDQAEFNAKAIKHISDRF